MSKSIFSKRIAIVTIVSYILYFSQPLLGLNLGNFIGKVAIGIILLIGILCLLRELFQRKTIVEVSYLIFFILITISLLFSNHEIVGPFGTIVSPLQQYKSIAVFSLMLFIGITVERETDISDKFIANTGIIYFLFACIIYYYERVTLGLTNDIESITNNSGYMIVAFVPFVPYIFKCYKKTSIVLLGISLFLVILSNKRGAILTYVILLIYLGYIYLKNNKISFKTVLGAILIAAGMIYIGIKEYESNEYLQSRIEAAQEGNSSGRNVIYSKLLQNFEDQTSFSKIFFGNGMSYTVKIANLYAHNDWLELLTDNGLVGVITYLIFYITAFIYFSKRSKHNTASNTAILILFLFFIKTFFSMTYTDITGGILMFILGVTIIKKSKASIKIHTKIKIR